MATDSSEVVPPGIYVLTGGPCSGKTTLLEELGRRGRVVIPEAATSVILEGRYHPSRDPLEFQRQVLVRQLRWELEALPGPAFADRAVGDHFGYLDHFRHHRGLDFRKTDFGRELEQAWGQALARYPAVFLCSRSPRFIPEPYRREDALEAAAIHQALARAYRERHPRVFELEWAPVEERAERLLEIARSLHDSS